MVLAGAFCLTEAGCSSNGAGHDGGGGDLPSIDRQGGHDVGPDHPGADAPAGADMPADHGSDLGTSDAAHDGPTGGDLPPLDMTGSSQTFNLSGTVFDVIATPTPAGISGATVSVADRPSITTTTASDGTFTLAVPAGTLFLRAEAATYESAQSGLQVSADVTGLKLYLAPEAGVEMLFQSAGVTQDPSKGDVVVLFTTVDRNGGYGATLSAAHDPSVSAQGATAMVSNTTQGGSTMEPLIFPNVTVGTTMVTLVPSSGHTCSLTPDLGSWRVDPMVITFVMAACQ
jgi:hypothetical protein